MNEDFKRFLFLVMRVVGVFLPSYVSAKEYMYEDFYNKEIPLFDGDKIISNGDHQYTCGGGQVCKACGEEFSLYSVTYNGKLYKNIYDSRNSSGHLKLDRNYVFNYKDFVDYVISGDGLDLTSEFSEEDLQLVKSLLEDNSRVPYVTSCTTLKTTGGSCSFYGYGLCLNFDTKIVLNLGYLDVNGATHDNPVSYKKEDGTIVLKDLQRDGYEFGGWYLDSDFKYRVTELDEDFYNDYFNDSGKFKDINKIPVRDNNGDLIGKVNLYAKWVPNNGTTGISVIDNPNTLAPIGIVIGVLLIVGVATGVIFSRKKKNNDDMI